VITTRDFRAASGCFGTGITVVTTVSGGRDHAMTANSFTSVSLDPMLVLVCADHSTRFHDAVLDSGFWGVSILAVPARDAAVRLASKGRPLEGQLDEFPYARGPVTGTALLTEALATLECRTWATYDGGDHTVVVGEVVGLELLDPDGPPLAYQRGRYATLVPLDG
jgi:flavin reductase (DIM6/NTAB) family NADH-FMN oxidoreductase RutF